jgi:hypothetical protein
VGFVQHDRTMSRRETYDYCAERTGFKAAAIRAVFMALAEFIKENQRKGNITYLDGIASIRNYVKGAFAGLSGPWVKGANPTASLHHRSHGEEGQDRIGVDDLARLDAHR